MIELVRQLVSETTAPEDKDDLGKVRLRAAQADRILMALPMAACSSQLSSCTLVA